MQALQGETVSYTKCIEISKKVRWDIDKDVIRGRELIFPRNFFLTASPKSTSWISSPRMNNAS